MARRPTAEWRALAETDEITARLFPPGLLHRYDAIFDTFERAVRTLTPATPDDELTVAIRDVVTALNTLNDDHTHAAIATAERDLLCGYIEQTLADSAADLDAFCTRHHLPRHELTDPWRTW
ncbi:hypothetical protein [Actinoplanes sp. NPDC051411]|jgi:hypothetical protein|uniref:hypothetical protein n=1 Tax=Actinoplanes sp. NPDC051411 TaxID=3155522 RepID=UPI00341A20EC